MFGVNWRVNTEDHIHRAILSLAKADQSQDLSAERPRRFWWSPAGQEPPTAAAIKALGRQANRRKLEKHFDIDVHDAGMDWARNRDRIEAEARLDGNCVIRTSMESASLAAEEAVEA